MKRLLAVAALSFPLTIMANNDAARSSGRYAFPVAGCLLN